MLDVLTAFTAELRAGGLPVSLTETLDAVRAVRHVDLADRRIFREALAATLVKRAEHRAAFDALFDVYFAGGPAQGVAATAEPAPGGEEPEQGGDAASALAELVERALEQGDDGALPALARRAVSLHAGLSGGRPVGGTYHLYRTLRHLGIDEMVERVVAGRPRPDGPTALDERLQRDEIEARVSRLRAEIDAEIRRRLIETRGVEAMVRSVRRPLPEDLDFVHATRDEVRQLQRAVEPLARRLAARVARRRRHRRRGALDFRRTVRASLSSGGVPVDPRYRHPRPSRPEIMLLADVSGSVAAFARFTLQFVYALSSQFSKVRSFAFVDGIDEVTRFFEGTVDLSSALARVATEADVVAAEGHSDYGRALQRFWARWGEQVTPRTTVIVLGDARNNYHATEAWVLGEVRRRARHLYWLNPEPRSYWDTGDSVVSRYAAHCDGVFECRNLRQLQRFVEALAHR